MRATMERARGPRAVRLPRNQALPSRGSEIARGLLALVATIVVVIGVPVGLLAAFGTPWPHQRPSVDWLTQQTSTDAVLHVLAFVVWLAWAHFVVCLVVEAVAERRRRGVAPHIPGAGIGTQALARRAIATIALLAGGTAVTLAPASAAVSSGIHDTSRNVAVASQSHTPQTAARESHGSGPAARGGTVLPSATQLVEANRHDVKAGVQTFYEVRPPAGRHYDTLWDIADRYLGSGIRYKEIWELNKGLVQADGRALRDADLIFPGWVLRLPDDAHGPGLKVVAHVTDPPAADGGQAGFAGSTGVQARGEEATAPSGVRTTEDSGFHLSAEWSPYFGVAGGLALAGVFAGLRRRRASLSSGQLWARAVAAGGRPDPTDPTPDPDDPPVGARLRSESDPDGAARLDRALRSWRPVFGTPAPQRVSVGPAGVAMAFDGIMPGTPPPGWDARSDRIWTFTNGAGTVTDGAAPLPGLVCVGRRQDGSLLLINPEAVPGILALDGDEATARGLAMSIAVDTATHAWADRRTVTLVGFADDLALVGQGNVRRVDDLDRVLESLDNIAADQRNRCRSAGRDTVLDARLGAHRDEWTYHLVVCSGLPTAEQVAHLQALAADAKVALGAVVIGPVPDAAMTLAAHPGGRLTAPQHGIDVQAQVLDVRATRGLSSLYEVPETDRSVGISTLAEVLAAERTPTATTEAQVRIGVLGEVTVTAPGEVGAHRREFLTELACFLALHPDGVHANRISAALWPRGVDDSLRDGVLRQLSDWLGATADGSPVLVGDNGVWRLAAGAVDLDWTAFRNAVNLAGAETDAGARRTHLRRALGLVRGPAFAGVPAGRYIWLESEPIEADIMLAVILTARALAESDAAAGDVASARDALARGLALAPASEELWRSRLQLEAQHGSSEDVRAVADAMYASIAAEGSPFGASAQTDALVDELLPGYRAAVA